MIATRAKTIDHTCLLKNARILGTTAKIQEQILKMRGRILGKNVSKKKVMVTAMLAKKAKNSFIFE